MKAVRNTILSALVIAALASCAAYDPQTFASAAYQQRCADYRAQLAAYNSAAYQMTAAEIDHYDTVANFVDAYCV